MTFKNIEKNSIQKGLPHPLGSTPHKNGVNFAIYSHHAQSVTLEFFKHADSTEAYYKIDLDSQNHRTGDVWHVWIADILPGQLYGYRIDGEFNPKKGLRFNSAKLLIDPYAKALTYPKEWDYFKARGDTVDDPLKPSHYDNTEFTPKSIYINDQFDWQNTPHPLHDWKETIIYETHVRGFTIHDSANVQNSGTYLGIIEKIPYLQDLGITAIELLPMFEFNHNQAGVIEPKSGKALKNYWGYDTVSYFSPKASYSSLTALDSQVTEFKTMVRELHKAKIEVILDVVFNHTAEGNECGPTLTFRGIDNPTYYHLNDDQRYYKNFAGTGNTVNANNPIVQDHIIDSLRYWVQEMHVDGFRFDLASLLNLDPQGFLLTNSPLVSKISQDPVLQKTKLIAEAWGPGGIYQVGNFGSVKWAEWNGRFRDDIRRFWKGNENMIGLFAARVCGSADVFSISGKSPANSINFITCHDGFTLNDLVSYSQKNNYPNAQNNEDGEDQNESSNYGHEGVTNDQTIKSIRIKQIKNFLLTLFISRGVPMLLGGDEFRRTQQGNNNAYCQDNEISWYNWDLLKKNKEIFEFTKFMIQFRKTHLILHKTESYTQEEIQWFNPFCLEPDWKNPTEKMCAFLLHENESKKLYFMFNAYTNGFEFQFPEALQKLNLTLIVDTSKPHVHISEKTNFLANKHSYYVDGHSSVIIAGSA